MEYFSYGFYLRVYSTELSPDFEPGMSFSSSSSLALFSFLFLSRLFLSWNTIASLKEQTSFCEPHFSEVSEITEEISGISELLKGCFDPVFFYNTMSKIAKGTPSESSDQFN